jgi:hypothetical protein
MHRCLHYFVFVVIILFCSCYTWPQRSSSPLLKLAIASDDVTTKYYNSNGEIDQLLFSNELVVSTAEPCIAFVDQSVDTVVIMSCRLHGPTQAPSHRRVIDRIIPSNISYIIGGYGPDSVFARYRLNRFIEMHRLKFGEPPSMIATCSAFASICTPFLHPTNKGVIENEFKNNIAISRPLAIRGIFGHVCGSFQMPILLLMCVDNSGNVHQGSYFHIGLSKSQYSKVERLIAQLPTKQTSTQSVQRYSSVIATLKDVFDGASCDVEVMYLSFSQCMHEKIFSYVPSRDDQSY